jgi:hypothetical protein
LCTALSSARHLQRSSTSSDMRDLCLWRTELGEKWPVNLAWDSDFHVNRRVLLHDANLRHGTDGFTSPPTPEKSDGFGRVRTRDLEYQRSACLPLDHRSRRLVWNCSTYTPVSTASRHIIEALTFYHRHRCEESVAQATGLMTEES